MVFMQGIHLRTKMKKILITELLKEKLYTINKFPVTMIEAPQGYGKTSALQMYLEEQQQQGALVKWHTCMGETAVLTWNQLCEMFQESGLWHAHRAETTQTPDLDTLIAMITTLRHLQWDTPTYLVLDHYELVRFVHPYEVIRAFSMHGCENLHMIFVTSNIDAQKRGFLYTNEIYRIGPEDFLLDCNTVAARFRSEGVRVNEHDLDAVMRISEGCPSAVACILKQYQKHGTADCYHALEQLIKHTVWDLLDESEQEFLMKVSLLDRFDAAQAAEIAGCSVLTREADDFLRYHALVRFDINTNTYQLFDLLRQYALRQIRSSLSEQEYYRTVMTAAKSCEKRSRLMEAAQLYLTVGDYQAVLALNMDNKYLCEQNAQRVVAFMEEVLRLCPRNIQVRYPHALMHCALFMLLDMKILWYQTIAKSIQIALKENPAGLSQNELNQNICCWIPSQK